jgi:hypothetical protein
MTWLKANGFDRGLAGIKDVLAAVLPLRVIRAASGVRHRWAEFDIRKSNRHR